jgi:hypothetical protein
MTESQVSQTVRSSPRLLSECFTRAIALRFFLHRLGMEATVSRVEMEENFSHCYLQTVQHLSEQLKANGKD